MMGQCSCLRPGCPDHGARSAGLAEALTKADAFDEKAARTEAKEWAFEQYGKVTACAPTIDFEFGARNQHARTAELHRLKNAVILAAANFNGPEPYRDHDDLREALDALKKAVGCE